MALAWSILACLTLAWSTVGQAYADDDFNAEGYRRDHYRAPTPIPAPGATTITVAQLHEMLVASTKPVGLIDVLPSPPRPTDLAADALWLPPRHDNIPGSLWLPDTGQPVLSGEAENYLRRGIEKSIGHNPATPVVFYCREDCWMSWNAAKRAALWGYHVLWYPGGVEGWTRAGYPLAESRPESK